jgi:rhodanese-related sulfurtransferase
VLRRFLCALINSWLILGLTVIAAQASQTNEAASSSLHEPVPIISVQQLQMMLHKVRSVRVYDVRQPEEYKEGHIKGAILMPLGDLASRCKEIPKEKTIVVYCRSGRKSAVAVALLRAYGYTKVFSLSGGYLEWSRAQRVGQK